MPTRNRPNPIPSLLALLLILIKLPATAQQDTSISLKYLVKDSASGKFVSSKVIEVNAKKETIFNTLFTELPQGKLRDDIAKSDPYTNLKVLHKGTATHDRMTFFAVLNRKEFGDKTKFSLDPAKSNTPFAFWRKESDVRDGQFVSILTILSKDNKLKFIIEDVKYFPESFDLIYSYILGQMLTYESVGFPIEVEDMEAFLAEKKKSDKKFKPSSKQKEVAQSWDKIRQLTLQSYEAFSAVLESYIKKTFAQNDF